MFTPTNSPKHLEPKPKPNTVEHHVEKKTNKTVVDIEAKSPMFGSGRFFVSHEETKITEDELDCKHQPKLD
jgi:hypothetical protein